MNVRHLREGGSGPLPVWFWQVGPEHPSIEFQVTHMTITTVVGRFTAFLGTVEAAELGTVKASGIIQPAHLDPDVENRGEDLCSVDFFDADTDPELSFVSTEIVPLTDSEFRVAGNLMIEGQTRSVELTGTVLRSRLDPWGNERVKVELSGEIDCRDFGVAGNLMLETDGKLVREKVKIELELSASKPVVQLAA